MRVRNWKWAPLMGAVVLALATVPSAMAECGLPGKAAKPSAWQPVYGGAHVMRAALGNDRDRDDEPSIVGMWHVVFTGQTMNGGSYSLPNPFDNSVVVWHPDGTEIMNSSRPAQDGNFCLGVWTQTGRLKYFLNHIPWQGNDPMGNPQGGAQILEKIELSPDGNSYSGSFSFTAYDTTGKPTLTITGTLAATRITPATPFGNLL
jgi:hypothetical protein